MGSFILRVPNIYFFLFPNEKVNFASHKQTSYFCKKKITFVLRPDVLFVLQTSGFDYVNMFGKQSFIGTSNHKQMLNFFLLINKLLAHLVVRICCYFFLKLMVLIVVALLFVLIVQEITTRVKIVQDYVVFMYLDSGHSHVNILI